MKKSKRAKRNKDLMVIKVRQAKNGLILEAVVGDSPLEEVAYQERYDDEVECFADLLRLLDEHFGPTTSRYSPKRIYVRVEQGDKLEDKVV